MTGHPDLLASMERFNLHRSWFFATTLASTFDQFKHRIGAAGYKNARLDDEILLIKNQLLATRVTKKIEHAEKLKSASSFFRSITHRKYKEDVWRTTIVKLAICYIYGTHKVPAWSRAGMVSGSGITFRVFVSQFQIFVTRNVQLPNGEKHKRNLDRIAIDTLAEPEVIAIIDEILDRVQSPEKYAAPLTNGLHFV